MENQTYQQGTETPFNSYRSKSFKIDDDAIVIHGNSDVDLPQQCIYCCDNSFLNRRENKIASKKSLPRGPKVLISYYLCKAHSKASEMNCYIVIAWLVLAILGLRIFPLKLLFLPVIISGYFLIKTVVKNSRNLFLKKYENGKFWITGVSPEFLAKIKSMDARIN